MRPRSKTVKVSLLCTAIKDLREALGQTQQQFAQTLGTAVTTIARYETGRNPTGQILIRLKDLAREHKQENLDDVFYTALVQEFPSYRTALSVTIASRFIKSLLALEDIRIAVSRKLRPRLEEVMADLWEGHQEARLLDPVKIQVPRDPHPADFPAVILPQLFEGVQRLRKITPKERARIVKSVSAVLAQAGRPDETN